MTMLEAFKKSQEERGTPMAQIEECIKLYQSVLPMDAKMANMPIAPGEEREIINGFKNMAKMWQAMVEANPEAVRQHIVEKIQERAKGN